MSSPARGATARLPYYIVNAFTDSTFGGNTAAVMLLDEWLAGLNPSELETGIKLIQDLRSEGRTIILVEHVMDAIRSVCDRCVVMASGQKIAEGIPSEVLSNPVVISAYLGDEDA